MKKKDVSEIKNMFTEVLNNVYTSEQIELPLTAQQLAEKVGVKPSTILNYYQKGFLPGYKFPGLKSRVYFYRSEFNKALTSKG